MKVIKGFEFFNRKKNFVVLALCLFLSPAISLASPCGYGLYTCSLPVMMPVAHPPAITEWVLDASIGNVDFYHAITLCNGEKVVFLKFNNKNSYPVKANWKEVFKIKSGESKDGFNGKKELILAPGITTPNDCSDKANKKSIILPSEIDPALVTEILDFNFKEVTVNIP
jgi:hypothetical protein